MIDYNYTTDLKPSIATVPKFLSAEDFRYATEFAKKAPYIWGESDGPGKLKPTGMIYDIMDEMIGVGELDNGEILPEVERNVSISDKDQYIIDMIDSNICSKFPEMEDYDLYRAYINCFAPREIANFHQDCADGYDAITFIFYGNELYTGLNDGGATEFYLDDKIIAIPPVPNTLLKFTAWVYHRATPLKSDHRFTYAFKYCRKDY